MLVKILVDVDDSHTDADDRMGITNEAYERLSGHTEHGPGALSWLGEVQDVEKAGD